MSDGTRDDRSADDGSADGASGRIARGIELTPEHPLDRLADLAADAEREGFDAVLAACHYNNRDPFVACSEVAAATDDVLVGPAAANPYDTHPLALASRMATIDEVSGGRGAFGLAPGDRSTLSTLGVERERPLRRTLETMRVARQVWDGETVDHDGTFRAADAGLNYEPPSEIPVYVGAQGPNMLRMAGKHADGVLVNASHPKDLSWARDRIEEGRAERPADRPAPQVTAYLSVSVAADGAAAREAARPPVAFIVGGAEEPVIERHGIDREAADRVSAALEESDFSAAFDAVTEPMIEAFAVAGTPDEVAERLDDVGEYVDGVVIGAPLGPDLEAAVSLAGAAVRRARA